MHEFAVMLQSAIPTIPAYYDSLGLLLYMLWNEARHRRNGHGDIATTIKETAEKLSLLALQGAGVTVRLDSHEARLGNLERGFHEYRREIRSELKEQATKLSRLEGRLRVVEE